MVPILDGVRFGEAVPGRCRRSRSPARELADIQIQDDYSGASLATLAGLGLEVYGLIPHYRDRCPLCGGRDCAVRHGIYRRRVADRDGSFHEDFPVPRFRCRRRGVRPAPAVTFSVLPAELVPRKRASLPLVLRILELLLEAHLSVACVLDATAEAFSASARPWFLEPPAVYRLLALFSEAYFRLGSSTPAAPVSEPGASSVRARARHVLRVFSSFPRGSPVVLSYHRRRFPHLLLEPVKAS